MKTGNILQCPACGKTVCTNLSYFARGWRKVLITCPFCKVDIYIDSCRKPLYEVGTLPQSTPAKYHDMNDFMVSRKKESNAKILQYTTENSHDTKTPNPN